DGGLHQNDGNGDQHDRGNAVEPWRAAEKQPPQQDQQRADHAAEQRDHRAAREKRRDHRDEYLYHGNGDTGPEAKGLAKFGFVNRHDITSAVRSTAMTGEDVTTPFTTFLPRRRHIQNSITTIGVST